MPCSDSNLDNFFNRWSPQVSYNKKENGVEGTSPPGFLVLYFFVYVFFSAVLQPNAHSTKLITYFSAVVFWIVRRSFILNYWSGICIVYFFCETTLLENCYFFPPIAPSHQVWLLSSGQIRFCILSTRMDKKRHKEEWQRQRKW